MTSSVSGYRTEVLSGQQGDFQIAQLVIGSYTVTVNAAGYREEQLTVRITPGGILRMTFTLAPETPSSLSAQIVDPQGGALPGALVVVRGPNGANLEGVADEAGRVVFPGIEPGTWSLTGSLSGFLTENGEAVVPFGGSADTVLELPLDYGITETVVVVGSRRTDEQRSVTSSAVPVDVLTAEALSAQPRGSLADTVRTLAPSFNVNTQPISDAATVIRPVNLRNLAPDHILVLVNGKRRHRGAVIAWLGNGIADGSQGPDMSVIPAIAIRQAELLRDGAAAQYGSDAIAGVINFQLKDAREGGSLELRSGLYQDRNAGDRSTCGANSPGSLPASCNAIGDRAGGYSFAGNVGLPIGNAGFANLSMEYGGERPTNRAV